MVGDAGGGRQRSFEVQDDAAADASGRQPAMGLGRERGRHDLGDVETQGAIFGEIPELLKQRGVGHRPER